MPGDTRYAVYFAPAPETALWRFGSSVLGYDAASGQDLAPAVPEGWSPADWHGATEEPRRYGFHATLKAPFRLADGIAEADLRAALDAFCSAREPVELPGLRVEALGAFVALVPVSGHDSLAQLEAASVRAFDALRAPLGEAEIVRRKPETLSPRQRQHLERWGYPFVLEDFRFHMTLSGPLPAQRIAATRDGLARLYREAGADLALAVDRLGLFRQHGAGRFRLVCARLLGAPAP